VSLGLGALTAIATRRPYSPPGDGQNFMDAPLPYQHPGEVEGLHPCKQAWPGTPPDGGCRNVLPPPRRSGWEGSAAPVGAPGRPAAERRGRCVPTVAADGTKG